MLKIGLDKTDRDFRKFEYDDERMFGNPLMFKVLYEETGGFGEVLCSNVISVKKSNNTHNHFLDIPVYKKKVDSNTLVTPEPVSQAENVDSQEKKKAKSTSKSKSKAKSDTIKLTGKSIEVQEPILKVETTDCSNTKSFEYDVLTIDNISYTEDIRYRLNEYGKDGWELCGFQIVQRLFGGGCQALIIMKKGLI